MKALVVDKPEAGPPGRAAFRDFAESELPEGDVLLRVSHSTVNYKDGLAVTGRAPVVRRFPMVPGIDLVGVVEQSSNPAVKAGDKVLLNGWGVGETHCGAYAPMPGSRRTGWCRCPKAWPRPRPRRSARRAIPRCSASWPWNATG